MYRKYAGILVCLMGLSLPAVAERMDSYHITGHGQGNMKHPAWFKQSFLDLREDLGDARKAGKRGILIFFSQQHCSHCQAFLDTTLKDPPTQARLRKSFDVIGLDIFNDLELTDIDGTVTTIRDFAEAAKARLTPTLIFYGVEQAQLVKIIGLYPPEKFNRVLDYIEQGEHQRVSLSQYLQNAAQPATAPALKYDHTLFAKPPHNLARHASAASKPLLVIFDKANCNPCARFHQRVLADPDVQQRLGQFEAIQLDTADNQSRVITPDGQARTPQQWAGDLQLYYDIAVLFFDEQGKEVHRLDAETGRDRMYGSMQYVLEKAYLEHEQFLRWRREMAREKRTKP